MILDSAECDVRKISRVSGGIFFFVHISLILSVYRIFQDSDEEDSTDDDYRWDPWGDSVCRATKYVQMVAPYLR